MKCPECASPNTKEDINTDMRDDTGIITWTAGIGTATSHSYRCLDCGCLWVEITTPKAKENAVSKHGQINMAERARLRTQ